MIIVETKEGAEFLNEQKLIHVCYDSEAGIVTAQTGLVNPAIVCIKNVKNVRYYGKQEETMFTMRTKKIQDENITNKQKEKEK